jgi:hypothetical protein
MKVAVNKCYGGFRISDRAFEALIAKGWTVTQYDDNGNCEDPTANIVDSGQSFLGFSQYSFIGSSDNVKLRTNAELIDVVESLGAEASGMCGNIQIVEIPDDITFSIEDYDGYEHVAEVHRTW